jgi:hypothetical protein
LIGIEDAGLAKPRKGLAQRLHATLLHGSVGLGSWAG